MKKSIEELEEILKQVKLDIVKAAEKNTSTLTPEVSDINIRFGYVSSFNLNYHYDVASNTYLRSFEDGAAHEVYKCPNENLGEVDPENVCNLTQLAPKVVVAMVVQESRAADGYYESISMIGSGNVYIFQNGKVITGSWNKGSVGEQIRFTDNAGNEIKLVPGQAIVTAVPNYGGVEY